VAAGWFFTAAAGGRLGFVRAYLALNAAVGVAGLLLAGSCYSVSTVRLQPETVHVGTGLQPMAAIQADASSAYLLFFPIAGRVSLDRVVNQMLIVTAKAMGADKVADVSFDMTPEHGIWTLRRLLGWRSARASGIAVQVAMPAPDPMAELGPESSPSPAQRELSTPAAR
jgi:hypothetical protein